MIPELYTRVVLNRDIPEQGLKRGDTAMYIEYLTAPGVEDGAILEIFNALGEEIRIATVPLSAIEALRADHLPSVRVLDKSA